MARRKAPHIPDAILDQLLAGADPKTAFESDGLLDALKKALPERALNAEMDHHLAGEDAGNSRNGYGRKTVTTETGRIELSIPRDRQATFDPQLIARYQRRFPGFDDKIVSMYTRGMSSREIVGHLRELYGIVADLDDVSDVAGEMGEAGLVRGGMTRLGRCSGPRSTPRAGGRPSSPAPRWRPASARPCAPPRRPRGTPSDKHCCPRSGRRSRPRRSQRPGVASRRPPRDRSGSASARAGAGSSARPG